MNALVKSLLLLILSCVLSISCRTDGGDIGYLYGQWALRDYTIDDVTPDISLDQYYWSFQGNLVLIDETLQHGDFIYNFGTWQLDGDTLSLDFTHKSINTDGSESFVPLPEELGIPTGEVTPMKVIKLTSSALSLSFTDALGRVHTYYLEKLK